MNKHILTKLSLAIVVAVLASCQRIQKKAKTSSVPKDTVISQDIKPAESGYADVNGLKMYYEVSGEGDPIIVLHGGYMNIPSMGEGHPWACEYS